MRAKKENIVADSILSQDEDAIISALESALPYALVESFPGSPEEAFELLHPPDGAAYVLYNGGTFGRGESSPSLTQAWQANFRILIVSDSLRSREDASRGAYEMVDSARTALSGLELPGGGCLELQSERVFRVVMGKFAYVMDFFTKNRFWRKQ